MTARTQLPSIFAEHRLIAVLRRLGMTRVREVAAILQDCGVPILEVTLDGMDAVASIEWLAASGFHVGAGTVMTVEQAAAARDAGAEFLVSPSSAPLVTEWAVSHAIPNVAGGFTPSEIVAAWSSGTSAVKLFPASLGGPAYLAAVRSPLGDIPIIPTGGISDANAAEYLSAGALAVGVGGWLSNGDVEDVERRAKALVRSIGEQG